MEYVSWGARDVPHHDGTVPKIIWAYWHDASLPPLIQACLKSWKRYAPDYTINLLNKDTVSDFTGPVPYFVKRRSAAAMSDWVRLKLLEVYGGIWMDASILLLAPIETLLPQKATDGAAPFAFYNRVWTTDPRRPMMESWFIASCPKEKLIQLWRREYEIACISRKSYLFIMKHIYGQDKLFQGYKAINYFTVFAVLQAVLWRNKDLHMIGADSETGPYKLHAMLNYNATAVAKAILTGDLENIHWIKMTNLERSEVLKGMESGWITANSPLNI